MNRLKRILSLILIVILAATAVTFAAGFDDHEIKFDKILNARDLGGYRTKDGRKVKEKVLIRSGELSYATKRDLKKLKKEYKVKRVIDFRYRPEYKYCRDKRISGAVYKNIPAKYNNYATKKTAKRRYNRFKGKSRAGLRKAVIPDFGRAGRSYTYELVMSSYSQKKYREYFTQLLANKDADGVVLHCVYGKDRTGVAAFMTLTALGVSEKTAYKEYAMTNAYLRKYGKKAYSRGGLGVREADLRYAVKKAKKKYGSLNNFLKKAYGLDAEKRAKLRAIYTE